MIVRIMGEGQYDVADTQLDRLNEVDNRVLAAMDSGDESDFRAALVELLDAVRTSGAELAPDVLSPSDLILPPADASVEEVRELLSPDGLIPDVH